MRTRKLPAGLTADEKIIAGFVLPLLQQKTLPDEAFAAARKLLGTRGVVDLTLTCSYYTAICMAQAAFRPEMEPGKTSTLQEKRIPS